jgi:hypothetical protein
MAAYTIDPRSYRGRGSRRALFTKIQRKVAANVEAQRARSWSDAPIGPVTFDLPPRYAVEREYVKKLRAGTCTKLPPDGGPYIYQICNSGGSDGYKIRAFNRRTQKNAASIALEPQTKWIDDTRRKVFKVGWAGNTEDPAEAYIEREEAREKGKPVAPTGLGTRVYERAMRVACDVGGGYAITSDTTRSVFSEAFWRKQVAKGRATCEGDGSESSYYESPLESAKNTFAQYEGWYGPLWRKFKAGLPEPEEGYSDYETYTEEVKVYKGEKKVEVGEDEKGKPIYEKKPHYEYVDKEKKKEREVESRWPCDYYALRCAGRPDSLDGLKRGRKR